jgi:hypothetical protein
MWLFNLSHFFPYSSGSILYHCVYGCMFCMCVCVCVFLFNFVNYVFLLLCILLLVYVFLLLCMFRSGYLCHFTFLCTVGV